MANPKPADSPRTVCPFLGLPIEYVQVGDGRYWQARCGDERGGWITTLFQTRQQLEWFLAHRTGVAPTFPPQMSLKITVLRPPEADPLADQKEQAAYLEEAAHEVVDRVLHDVSGR